jgi:hypothetical protein
MELKLNEVEVTKLNLQPGETLVVTLRSDEIGEYDMDSLGAAFRKAFPNNRVAVLNVGTNGDVKFQSIKEEVKDLSCSNSPVGYCGDCNCGKREQIEGAK